MRVFLPAYQAWTFARLPRLLADAGIHARTVLHVGAHHGEEVAIYRQCGFATIRLVEPDPGNLAVLGERYGADPDIDIIAVAATPAATPQGNAKLWLAERSVWSGLQPHPSATGEKIQVPTVTLGVLQSDENLLVLDTQGSELELLRTADLRHLDMVIVETTRRPGDTAADYSATTAYMRSQHWRAAEEWVHDNSGYTDTVFLPQ